MFVRCCAAAILAASAAGADTIVPDFATAEFGGSSVVNPFFPLVTGPTRVYAAEGVDDEGEPVTERSEMTVTGPGPVILGIATITVLDRAYEGDRLVEETYDHYATDDDGNVWYFGEDVTNYIYDEDGMLVGTNSDSAWLAGVDGAMPGWIMPADPTDGLSYFQEVAAANGALDEALVWQTGQTVEIAGVGVFTGVLVTLETSSLDPALREFKYYAPGIGLIRADEGLSPEYHDPELVFMLQPTQVPVPGAMGFGLAGLCALGLAARRRRA